jgi:hypothetical protein
MKIKKVTVNNRKKAFEVITTKGEFDFPFSRLRLKPTDAHPVTNAHIDKELGSEAFTYALTSRKEDSVHIDQVMEYNKDPDYMRKTLLYKLTIQAQKMTEARGVSKRELVRRLRTSPTQLYRLLDQSFYGKTLDQMIRLLSALDCTVDFTFGKIVSRNKNPQKNSSEMAKRGFKLLSLPAHKRKNRGF